MDPPKKRTVTNKQFKLSINIAAGQESETGCSLYFLTQKKIMGRFNDPGVEVTNYRLLEWWNGGTVQHPRNQNFS